MYIWKLDSVRHVPSLRNNLISIEQLAKDGYVTTFAGDMWKILRRAMIVAYGEKNRTLYMTIDGCESIVIVERKEDLNLWHQRLSHMSSKRLGIKHLNKKLSSLKSVDIDMCESCILEKQRRVNFKKVGRTPKEAKLELVHIDVWGPALVLAIRGRSYFVTFIDDHSRKVLVYFMRHKFV